MPRIHSSLVKGFRCLGALVEEIPSQQALGRDPGFLISWPARKGAEAVLALDMGARAELTQGIREVQAGMGVPWVLWFLDHPEGYSFPSACDPDWTMAFCWDKGISLELSRQGPLQLRHLPLASDPSVFHPRDSQERPVLFSGVFVGSTAHANPLLEEAARRCPGLSRAAQQLWTRHREQMHIPMEKLAWEQAAEKWAGLGAQVRTDPLVRLWVKSCLHLAGRLKRAEVVEKVLGARGAVFGDSGWADLLQQTPFLGPVRYGPPLRDVYLRSSFVLEVRQPQSQGGLSQRVFDASLCNRPVLAEWSPELEHILGGPKRVFSFSSLEEAEEARARCLGFPAEAREMACLARKEVLSRHTFLHRAAFLLECLKKEFF